MTTSLPASPRGYWIARISDQFIAAFRGRPTVARAREAFLGTDRPIDIEPATLQDLRCVLRGGGIIHDVRPQKATA